MSNIEKIDGQETDPKDTPLAEREVRPDEELRRVLADVPKVDRGLQQEPNLADAEQGLRRSKREGKLTMKAQANLDQDVEAKEARYRSAYFKWKTEAKLTRRRLKAHIDRKELNEIVDHMHVHLQLVIQRYEEMRGLLAPAPEILRQVDCAIQISGDIRELITKRLGDDEDSDTFNPEIAIFNVRDALDKKANPSVFGSSVTESCFSKATTASHASLSKTESVAELAAKEAQLQSLQETQAQGDRLAQMQAECNRKLKEERDKLDRIKAEEDVKIAIARVQVFEHEGQRQEFSGEDSLKIPVRTVEAPTVPRQSQPLSTLPVTTSVPSVDLSTLLQAFQEGISLGRLPVPEPRVFSGDAMQFPEWENSFLALIDRKNIGTADKLFYLRKYTAGPAAKMIQGAFLRSDEAAYQDAWSKLVMRYGDPFIIQRAFREKIAQWPKVRERDGKALRDFSDFLNSCNEAIPHVKGLSVLNDCEENKKILQKLPEWIVRRWNRQVTYALREQEFPSFKVFCNFLTDEAEVACNPMTQFISHQQEKEPKVRVLATGTAGGDAAPLRTVVDAPEVKGLSPLSSICTFCKDSHSLHKCTRFAGKPMEDKKRFILANQLCFACLRHGHISKNCKRRATCATCKRSHPTPLHYDRIPKEKGSSQRKDDDPDHAVSAFCATNRGYATSMIMPVWVASTSDPGREVLTYAMLDTQSDSSFILDTTVGRLGISGQPVRLKLATMTEHSSITDCHLFQDITVRGLHESKSISIPKLYTREFIPAERSVIPTSATALRWPHLESVAKSLPPLQECEIGMLIGFNCPQALTPREVVPGQNCQPFAVRTDLGWSVVGGHGGHGDTAICHKVMTREGPITSKVLSILEKDFSENQHSEGTVSQEDLQFLHIPEASIKQLEDGHLQMPLPFRSRPQLPSNKVQAYLRLKSLRRKLERDPRYCKDYVNFVQGIIENGEAEEAPPDVRKGEVWYLPHHGVYHPKKPGKIRVVFHCSSQCQGVALNDHLLSGPDLTNTLVGVLCRFRKHQIAIACDIERMFHQFIVNAEDRDYLRFLWWKNGDLTQEPMEYRMKVHLFGAASSPGCANYGLKFLSKQYEKKFPLAAQFIRHHFYVDDGLISTETNDEAAAAENENLCCLSPVL